jgi:hypothetical protein
MRQIKSIQELIEYCANSDDWFLRYAISTIQDNDNERD